jgi:hypothetical protein
MIDYSTHRLQVLKLDKDLHKQLLQHKYEEALQTAEMMHVEQKLLINAVKDLINQRR